MFRQAPTRTASLVSTVTGSRISTYITSRVSRRQFLRGTAALGGMGLLAACAPPAAPAAPSAAQPVSAPAVGAKTSLRLGSYTWGTVQDAYGKTLESYKQANPNVDIAFEFADFSGFMDKLTVQLASGTPPDVAMLIPDVLPRYVAQDLVSDLTPYMGKLDKTRYYEAAWQGLSFGEKTVAVPLTYDSHCLYFNKDLFDKAKLKYPDETWTYDNLVEAAKALTVKDGGGNVSQWGLGIGWEPWYQGMAMFGQQPWDQQDFTASAFDKPEVIDAIQKVADFYTVHKTTPVQPANSGISASGADVQFMAGNMAMLLGGTWMVQTYLDAKDGIKSFKWDIAHSPMDPATKKRAGIGQANVFVSFKASKAPDEAWKVIDALAVQDSGQRTLASAVEIPAVKAAAADTYKKAYLDKVEHGAVQLDMMDKHTINVQFGLVDENSWMIETDNQLDAVWKGEQPVADVCKALAAKLNADLATAQKKYKK